VLFRKVLLFAHTPAHLKAKRTIQFIYRLVCLLHDNNKIRILGKSDEILMVCVHVSQLECQSSAATDLWFSAHLHGLACSQFAPFHLVNEEIVTSAPQKNCNNNEAKTLQTLHKGESVQTIEIHHKSSKIKYTSRQLYAIYFNSN